MEENTIELYEGCSITIKDKDVITLGHLEKLKALQIDVLNIESFGVGLSKAMYDKDKCVRIIELIADELPNDFEFEKVRMAKFKEAVMLFFIVLGYSFQS